MRMNLQVLRLVVAYGMGAVFLAESLSHDPFGLGVDTHFPLIRFFIALFGMAWIVQAFVIQRRMSAHRS